MIQITYIDHSGYFMELEHHCLLFDYFRGEILVIPDKPLYVFVSHAHHDHYQPAIYQLKNKYASVTYILSDDIKEEHGQIKVHPNQTLAVDDLQLQTLPSTDEGVAFLLQVEGKTIYHAGDLNDWHWEEENTPEENEAAKQAYIAALSQIEDVQIDIACVVLDPRQEDQFYYGMDIFMRMISATHVFPMHLWGDYQTIEELKRLPQSKEYRDRIIVLHHAQEVFEL